MHSGVLSGYQREARLLPLDDDNDFAILPEDVEQLEDGDWKKHGLAMKKGKSFLYHVCFLKGGNKIPVQRAGAFEGRYLNHTWPLVDIFVMEEHRPGSGLYLYKSKVHRDNFPREGGMQLNRAVSVEIHGVSVRIPGNWKTWLDKAHPKWSVSAKLPSYYHKGNHRPYWNTSCEYAIEWLHERK